MGNLLSLIGLPSPAVLLGVLAALAAVGGWSYNAGHTNGFNSAEAARAKAQDGAVEELRQQLDVANVRAISEAAARGEAIAAADKAKASLSSALRELRNEKNKLPPSCNPTADWVRNVNAAVGAANSVSAGKADTGSLSIPLPVTAADGVGFKPVDSRSAGGGGGMPADSRNVPKAGD
jgi:hypothetical protein